jgi:hypothetical protein
MPLAGFLQQQFQISKVSPSLQFSNIPALSAGEFRDFALSVQFTRIALFRFYKITQLLVLTILLRLLRDRLSSRSALLFL